MSAVPVTVTSESPTSESPTSESRVPEGLAWGNSEADVSVAGLVRRVLGPIEADAQVRLQSELAAAVTTTTAAAATAADTTDEVVVDAVVESVMGGLVAELTTLVTLPLVQYFHEFRREHGFSADPSSNTALRSFAAGPMDELMGRFPLLGKRIDCVVSGRVDQCGEIVAAFLADRRALEEAALVGPGRLTAVDCSFGDPHGGGRRVARVRVGDDTVFYKCRDFGPDRMLRELVDAVSTHGDVDLVLPTFLERNGYGWQQCIRGDSLPSGDDPARRFHRRLGQLVALFGAVGTTDMHVENIVAHGEYPVPIDVETLLHPTTERLGDTGDHNDLLAAVLGDGPLGTSMLPSASDVVAGASIAAVSDAGERRVEGAVGVAITGDGTDAVSMEHTPVVMNMTSHRPHRSGEPIALGEYTDDVVAGCLSATSVLRARVEAVRAVIDGHGDVLCRRVLRPTAVYTAFLNASAHPRYLGSEAVREDLLAMVPPSTAGGQAALTLELAALRRGDVPRFVARADSTKFTEAGTGESTVVSPVLDTALQRAHRCVDAAVRTPPAATEHLLRSTLSTLVRPASDTAGERAAVRADLHRALTDPDVFAAMARVVQRIAARAVRRPDGSAIGLVQSLPAADGAATLVSSDRSLYDGAGSLLLTAALAGRSEDARWRRRLAAQTSTLALIAAPAVERGGRADPCPFSGALATWWLLRESMAISGCVSATATAMQAAGFEAVGDPTSRVDIVGGTAGAIALAASDPSTDRDVLERGSRSLAGHLDAAVPGSTRGLAHGVDGIAWALCRADAVLGCDEHRSLLVAVLDTPVEAAREPRNAGSSWCWGRTGILLTHAEIAYRLGDRDRAHVLAHRVEAQSADHDDTICHGETGIILTLTHLGVLLGDDSLLAAARTRGDLLLRKIAHRGYRTGHGEAVAELSLMTGVPGIAYARAVAAHPALANPVALTLGVTSPS